MARPLSEEKRTALLDAAVEAVASLGLAAPTAKIARRAGVADGTLFVYFPTKDDLLNQLALFIKEDLSEAVAVELARNRDVEDWLREFWDRYIDWGLRSPEKYKAMRQLEVSDTLTGETRKSARALFSNFDAMVVEGFKAGILREQPTEFVDGITDAIATMVLELAQKAPAKAENYKRLGWDAFWNAIARR